MILQTIILSFIGPWQWIIIGFAITMLILQIIALVDVIKNNFLNNNKVIWVLVIILLPLLGPILYFVLGAKQKIK